MNIFRNLLYMARRFRLATTLNLFGLVLALATFYLFLTQVRFNYSYNRNFPDYERVYRLEVCTGSEAGWWVTLCRPLINCVSNLPQVEVVTTMFNWNDTDSVGTAGIAVQYNTVRVADEGLAVFSPQVVDGSLDLGVRGEPTVLIPRSLAETLFGTPLVAGRHISLGGDSVKVGGVYADFPANCSMPNAVVKSLGDEGMINFSEYAYLGFVKLRENIDTDAFLADFDSIALAQFKADLWGAASDYDKVSDAERDLFEEQFRTAFGNKSMRLTPVSETYFSGVSQKYDKGNASMLFILELSCLLVLVIAAVNFLNFVLAQSPMRVKGVNTRRVLGQTVGHLRLMLVAESVTTALIACVVAVGVVCLADRSVELHSLLQGSISLADNMPVLLYTVLAALAIGLVAGCYPAWFITSHEPVMVLKASFGLTPKGRRLRTLLVCMQLFISFFVVTYIVILQQQSHYIYNSDYGFAKDEVMYADLNDELVDKRDALRAEIMNIPGVENVAYSRYALGTQSEYMRWGRGDTDDRRITFTCLPVDYNYLRTMGIKVIEGRDFGEHDSDCMIINEVARRAWPWVELDQPLIDGLEPVVGVCDNVRFASVRQDRASEPMAFIIFGENYSSWGVQERTLNVRVAANIDKVSVRRKVQDVILGMGGTPDVELRFIDPVLEQLYHEEFQFIHQVLCFSVVCLLITLIGVFCLTMFETEYRRKEIGIRKVMGSTTWQIIGMLLRRHGLLCAVSFVVAAPLAWHYGHDWLMNFAERTSIRPWVFVVSLTVVTFVTLATVVIQSWRTANENPVNSIKTE
ncbi:MAG: FtsX-like permease family protein [Bacteroidaceae bacterium]|nr:FtsX-like permease family protein [Bacteroidaceae bacterium]MBQ9177028.1 FtsX-like permease family protein [Bacteroidaceae bacterium]